MEDLNKVNFGTFFGDVTKELLLGFGLGFAVNQLAEFVSSLIDADFIVHLLIHIFLIVMVLYILNRMGFVDLENNYIFQSAFIVSQVNIGNFVNLSYKKMDVFNELNPFKKNSS